MKSFVEKKGKISILGDSISTWKYYIPYDYLSYYNDEMGREFDMTVESTWWMRIISALNGELEVNNSFAGSLVVGQDNPVSGCSNERCSDLGKDPDLIFIYMGNNDMGYTVDPRLFEEDFTIMLQRIKGYYPKAQIVVMTLIAGYHLFGIRNVSKEKLGTYNDVIRRVTKEQECILADLERYDLCATTIDGLHPDAKGQELIYRLLKESLSIESGQ